MDARGARADAADQVLSTYYAMDSRGARTDFSDP